MMKRKYSGRGQGLQKKIEKAIEAKVISFADQENTTIEPLQPSEKTHTDKCKAVQKLKWLAKARREIRNKNIDNDIA